jgi:hypothetical protein
MTHPLKNLASSEKSRFSLFSDFENLGSISLMIDAGLIVSVSSGS